ncbi:hypothetical protein BU16DRAFT_531430 [Lophium mytilinum]|uniref:MARVEL domain-containing protein n=1 Tax=Lophium mytilinum TaxID=390894 RepID=A0A6A6QDK2_9PEZI|nr:hypothetical protein BU16DRAFT_531430 [Lophium mytilinum]
MASPYSESLPAPETTSEEAPLLGSSDPSSEPPPTPRPQLGKPILGLTWLSLALAATTWPFLIALKVLWDHEPIDYHYSWGIRDDASALLGLSIAAAIFATGNLLRLRFSRLYLPLLLNLIADLVLAFYLIAVSANGIADGLQGDCYKSWYPPPKIGDPGHEQPLPVEPGCYRYAYRVTVLQEVVMSLGLVLGVTSLVLAVLRLVLAYRSKFWRRMSIPTGTFSVEFSVKILRQGDPNAPGQGQAQRTS